jgi:hypothetical protein
MPPLSAYLSPTALVDVTRALLWLALGLLFWLWIKRSLTPTRFLTIFESEGVLSVRLILATVVVLFTLCMQASERLSAALVEANYFLAGTLLGLGTAKVVGKAFAKRPSEPPATITTKKAEVTVAGDATINADSN